MFQCCVFSAPTSMKCPVALLFYSIWWPPTTLQSFRQRVYKHMIPPNPSSSVKQSACPKRSSTQIFQYKIDQFSNWNNKTHHKQRNVFSNQKNPISHRNETAGGSTLHQIAATTRIWWPLQPSRELQNPLAAMQRPRPSYKEKRGENSVWAPANLMR